MGLIRFGVARQRRIWPRTRIASTTDANGKASKSLHDGLSYRIAAARCWNLKHSFARSGRYNGFCISVYLVISS